MRLPLYQIDAFAEGPFIGNPAAVCPLESRLPDAVVRAIARGIIRTARSPRRPASAAVTGLSTMRSR